MTYSCGYSICCVIQFWKLFKPYKSAYHHLYLFFVGPSVTGYRCLNLQRCVFVNTHPAVSTGQHSNTSGLSHIYYRLGIAVEIKFLYTGFFGPVFLYDFHKTIIQSFQLVGHRHCLIGRYGSVSNRCQHTAFLFNYSPAHSCIARVYTEYSHISKVILPILPLRNSSMTVLAVLS